MNGVHDLGGMHGFGPVDLTHEDELFHEPWERLVFGMQLALLGRNVTKNIDESRRDNESLEPEAYLRAGYYERWLISLEGRLVRKGILTEDELGSRYRVLESAPDLPAPSNPDEAYVERVLGIVTTGGSSAKDPGTAPRFEPGEPVRTQNVHTRAHTRLARYVRGRRGIVQRVLTPFALPELAAEGEDRPEHVYSVRFDAAELWGESAEPNASVCVDLFESYLLPG